jgi:hypothetical protein
VHAPPAELGGAWFESATREAEARAELVNEPAYARVSRRRVRAAHAVFVIVLLGVLALATWEVQIYLAR